MDIQTVWVYPGQSATVPYGHVIVSWKWDKATKSWLVMTAAADKVNNKLKVTP